MIQDQKTIQPERKKMEDKWKSLTKQALMKSASFHEPISSLLKYNKKIFMFDSVPYSDAHIVGNFNGLNNGNLNNNM